MPTRQAAIRLKCYDCSAGDGTTIRCCQVLECALWDFRMGYGSKRNELYYDRNLYREHEDLSQADFNRILMELQMNGQETS